MIHLAPGGRIEIIGVAPLVHTHLAATQVHGHRQAAGQRFALAMKVDGDGRLVAMLHGPDDVLRTECSIASEEHPGQ